MVTQIRLNASMVQNVVTYTVVVAFDNACGKLLPYLTALLEFEVAQRTGVLLVPKAALRWQPESSTSHRRHARNTLGRSIGAGTKRIVGPAAPVGDQNAASRALSG